MTMVRWWVLAVLSGTAVGEIALDNPQVSRDFGGGKVSGDLLVNPLTLNRGGIDWLEAERLHALVEPGMRSIVATWGSQVLGEWIVTRVERTARGAALALSGIGWEQYPRYRSLHTDYVYEATSQMTIARALWSGAYLEWNDGMQIALPAATSSVTRSVEKRARTGYYSDALDEIAAPDDGFEWIIEHTPTWDGDRLTGVARAIVVGQPTLARPSNLRVEFGEADTRHGNMINIEGAEDWTRYSTWVVGVGAGQGDRQPLVQVEGPPSDRLKSVRNVSFPDVTDLATLTALTQAEVTAAQVLSEPYRVTAQLAELSELPRVGTSMRIKVGRCPAWPAGLDQVVRIGGLDFADLTTGQPKVTISAI